MPGDRPVWAEGLVKAYASGDADRDVVVLHGVSFSAGPGEMVGVVGPSGSGKSTLLYCLSGLEPFGAGRVVLLGADLASASRKAVALLRRGRVGFVFQAFHLVPSLTAEENVALPLLLDGVRDGPVRAAGALQAVGLGEYGAAYPRRLSGGQQQRVALARVLAQQPSVVFADEPTGALDQTTGRHVLGSLRALTQQGACVVLVTHDLQAAALADRVVVLTDGTIVDELVRPSPEAILHAMQSPRTAGGA